MTWSSFIEKGPRKHERGGKLVAFLFRNSGLALSFPLGFTLPLGQFAGTLAPKGYFFFLRLAPNFFLNFFRSSVHHLNAIELLSFHIG